MLSYSSLTHLSPTSLIIMSLAWVLSLSCIILACVLLMEQLLFKWSLVVSSVHCREGLVNDLFCLQPLGPGQTVGGYNGLSEV